MSIMQDLEWGADGVARGNFAGVNIWAIAGVPRGVVLPVRDSKDTKKEQRKKIVEEISGKCVHFIGAASVEEIEKFGIDMAEQRALRRALQLVIKAKHEIDCLYGDMKMPFIPQLNMSRSKDADKYIQCVSTASIFAKNALDLYWERIHQEYPQYDFLKNAGYGTNAKKAIFENGLIEGIHRKNYAPCREYLRSISISSDAV